MKHGKLIRRIIYIVLLVIAVASFTAVGIKSANCIHYGRQVNNYTEEINQLREDNPDDFYKPESDTYKEIEKLEAERKEANSQYAEWEVGIVPVSVTGFTSAFILIFLLVNGIKRD